MPYAHLGSTRVRRGDRACHVPRRSVIFGQLQQHPPSPKATALNPKILVEVTSDSSEEYDTGAKRESYQTIPSLRDYIVVSHRERRITFHGRNDAGQWTVRVAIAGGTVAVDSIGTTLSVDAIYRASAIR